MGVLKAWDSNADRDLFFALITVKKIVSISGVEWSQIGAIMRAAGYGFTNEGCRQHFQGIRRVHMKSTSEIESPGSTPSTPTDSKMAVDPNFDPISRRRRARVKGDEGPDTTATLPPPKPRFKQKTTTAEAGSSTGQVVSKIEHSPQAPMQQPPDHSSHAMGAPSGIQTPFQPIQGLPQPQFPNAPPALPPANNKRPLPSEYHQSTHHHPHSLQHSTYNLVPGGQAPPPLHQQSQSHHHLHRLNIETQENTSDPAEPFSKRLKVGEAAGLDDEAVLSLAAADSVSDDVNDYTGEF